MSNEHEEFERKLSMSNMIEATRQLVTTKTSAEERELLRSYENIFHMLVLKQIKSITFDEYKVIEKLRDELCGKIWSRYDEKEKDMFKKLVGSVENSDCQYRTDFQRSGMMCITWSA